MFHEITDPPLHFNFEVLEWINIFRTYFIMDVAAYSYWNYI